MLMPKGFNRGSHSHTLGTAESCIALSALGRKRDFPLGHTKGASGSNKKTGYPEALGMTMYELM